MPFEKKQKQPFSVDLVVWFYSDTCCVTDNVADTVDYSLLTHKVVNAIESTSFNLIEALADHMAQKILAIEHVRAVRISLTKENPPVKENIKHVKVTLLRQNDTGHTGS
ncbi:MAG: dihydroneopterin aldolase [Firmicutes bacterium]|nr:dihydroneopterin aldolase [Bacillota bacterium]